MVWYSHSVIFYVNLSFVNTGLMDSTGHTLIIRHS